MHSALTTFSIPGWCHAAIIGRNPAQSVRAIGLICIPEEGGAGAIVTGSDTNARKSQVHCNIATSRHMKITESCNNISAKF